MLAELFHLLGEDRRQTGAAWGLLCSGVVTVLPIGDDDLETYRIDGRRRFRVVPGRQAGSAQR